MPRSREYAIGNARLAIGAQLLAPVLAAWLIAGAWPARAADDEGARPPAGLTEIREMFGRRQYGAVVRACEEYLKNADVPEVRFYLDKARERLRTAQAVAASPENAPAPDALAERFKALTPRPIAAKPRMLAEAGATTGAREAGPMGLAQASAGATANPPSQVSTPQGLAVPSTRAASRPAPSGPAASGPAAPRNLLSRLGASDNLLRYGAVAGAALVAVVVLTMMVLWVASRRSRRSLPVIPLEEDDSRARLAEKIPVDVTSQPADATDGFSIQLFGDASASEPEGQGTAPPPSSVAQMAPEASAVETDQASGQLPAAPNVEDSEIRLNQGLNLFAQEEVVDLDDLPEVPEAGESESLSAGAPNEDSAISLEELGVEKKADGAQAQKAAAGGESVASLTESRGGASLGNEFGLDLDAPLAPPLAAPPSAERDASSIAPPEASSIAPPDASPIAPSEASSLDFPSEAEVPAPAAPEGSSLDLPSQAEAQTPAPPDSAPVVVAAQAPPVAPATEPPAEPLVPSVVAPDAAREEESRETPPPMGKSDVPESGPQMGAIAMPATVARDDMVSFSLEKSRFGKPSPGGDDPGIDALLTDTETNFEAGKASQEAAGMETLGRDPDAEATIFSKGPSTSQVTFRIGEDSERESGRDPGRPASPGSYLVFTAPPEREGHGGGKVRKKLGAAQNAERIFAEAMRKGDSAVKAGDWKTATHYYSVALALNADSKAARDKLRETGGKRT